jgi:cytochrome b
MSILKKIRIYHALLAMLAVLSYATGELGVVHAWLGYGVAIVIAMRLLWALSGNPHVGLMRFYPSFEGLALTNIFTHPSITKLFMLGIAISLLAVTATGIAMDNGKAIGLTGNQLVSTAFADDNDDGAGHGKTRKSPYEEALEEGHELCANLLLLFVGLHVSYLLLFKRPLAKFMVFANKPNR